MAVDINSVYQKVLALANKEQRGYITPQEFNLFADKAQNEIYENYFHQLNVAQLKPKSIETESDPVETIRQKLDFFVTKEDLSIANDTGLALEFNPSVPSHRVIKIVDTVNNKQATRVEYSELHEILSNPLTAPTTNRKIYVNLISNVGFQFYPIPGGTGTDGNYKIYYYRQPQAPNWPYTIVAGNALFNSGSGFIQNFELHTSEEENLVNKILMLAGLTIKQPAVQQSAAAMMQMNKQEQNS